MNNLSFVDSLLSSAFATENIQADSVNEMLDKYGLNWKVAKSPLTLPGGIKTPFYGIARVDNNVCFSTCKDTYVPFQNEELAELVYNIAHKTGYEIHNGGTFNGGGKVYLQLSTGEVRGIGENNDIIKKFVTAINSHDGTTSLKWGHTNITISCGNTFNAAYKELKNSARHTNSIHQKVEQSLRQIEGLETVEKSLFDTYFKLAEQPVTQKAITEVVKNITTVDIALTKEQLKKDYSTYSINRMEELLQSIAGEMKQKGQTMWGLFSGVTQYTSHKMPAPNRHNGRLESKYVGSGFKIDNDALQYISLVNN
jgi:phage/plasmid-like protein (TIGR03299 family)